MRVSRQVMHLPVVVAKTRRNVIGFQDYLVTLVRAKCCSDLDAIIRQSLRLAVRYTKHNGLE